ncbi:hypothetical protein QW131_31915 [Roseibium salinum]|nr:hypothetical protein [Roseibium salinum]
MRLADRLIDDEIELLEAEESQYEAEFESVSALNPSQAQIFAKRLARTRASLEFWRGRQALNVVRARQAGEFVLIGDSRLQGRFVNEGDLLGYVLPDTPRVVRVLIPQERINDVRRDTRSVDVRFASALNVDLGADVVRAKPSAITGLPSAVLSPDGGGSVLVDPSQPGEEQRPLRKYYEVEVHVAEPHGSWRAEERAYVRFRHEPVPLGYQMLRSIREVFLRQFNV